MGTIRSRVAGVTFGNDDGSNRQEILSRMSKRRKLRFRDAATEDHPNAISVHNVKGDQLGFLPSDISEYIRSKEIDPTKLSGEVYSVSPNKDRSALGCLIDITNDGIESFAVGYQPHDYVGNQDWNSIREFTGKMDITASDVDAYNNAKANNPSPPIQPSTSAYQQGLYHERIVAERKNKKNKMAAIAALSIAFIIIVLIIYGIVRLFS